MRRIYFVPASVYRRFNCSEQNVFCQNLLFSRACSDTSSERRSFGYGKFATSSSNNFVRLFEAAQISVSCAIENMDDIDEVIPVLTTLLLP